MKQNKWNWLGVIGLLGANFVLASVVLNSMAQSVPQPVITIAPSGTNQFVIAISNGVSYANYELFHTAILGNPAYPWTLQVEGTLGQTNFTISQGMMLSGFYRASVGTNWDGDAFPNFEDANPDDAAVGILTITIDSPVSGTAFN